MFSIIVLLFLNRGILGEPQYPYVLPAVVPPPYRPYAPIAAVAPMPYRPQVTCPSGTTLAGPTCLSAFRDQRSWEEARMACSSRGLRLIEIRLANQYIQVMRYLQNNNLGSINFWTGISTISDRNRTRNGYAYDTDGVTSIASSFMAPYFKDSDMEKEPIAVLPHESPRCAYLNGELYHYHSTTNCRDRISGYICEWVPPSPPSNTFGVLPRVVNQVVKYNFLMGQDQSSEPCDNGWYYHEQSSSCLLITANDTVANNDDAHDFCVAAGSLLMNYSEELDSYLKEVLDSGYLYWVRHLMPTGQEDDNECLALKYFVDDQIPLLADEARCDLQLRYICAKEAREQTSS